MKDYFKAHKMLCITGILILVIFLTAILAPYITPYDPFKTDMQAAFQPPDSAHWFGTDKLGRDIFSRVIYGTRISMPAALILVAVICVVGTLLGIIAGFSGCFVDSLIMRISDMMISVPGMVLAIAIAGILGGSITNAVIALAAIGWTKYARLARSATLKIKSQDYISAAVVNGTKPSVILFRHILVNALPVLIVTAAMDVGTMMLELAGLSFLGFGAQAPLPEWGLMLNEGRQHMLAYPWLMVFPGLAITTVVVVFNLFGDALRDILDPSDNG